MASKAPPRKHNSKVTSAAPKVKSSSHEQKKDKLQNPPIAVRQEVIVSDTNVGDETLTADPSSTICTSTTAARAAHASMLYQKMLSDVANYEKQLMQEVLIKQCNENNKLKLRIQQLEMELESIKNKCMDLEGALKIGGRRKSQNKRVQFQIPKSSPETFIDPKYIQHQHERTDICVTNIKPGSGETYAEDKNDDIKPSLLNKPLDETF